MNKWEQVLKKLAMMPSLKTVTREIITGSAKFYEVCGKNYQ
jgi:hypothetical protein